MPAVCAATGFRPDDAELEAEGAAEDQQPDQERDDQREHEVPGQRPVAAGQHAADPAVLRQRLGLDVQRHPAGAVDLLEPEEGVVQERGEPDGDGVQHDRRDHLVDAAAHLEHAGIQAQAAPASIATTRISRMCNGPGSSTAGTDDGGDQHRHPVLALDADVEQIHLEPDRHRAARQDQRAGAFRGVQQLGRLGAVVEHLPVHGQRVVPGELQQQPAEHEGDARPPPTELARCTPAAASRPDPSGDLLLVRRSCRCRAAPGWPSPGSASR